MSRIADQQKVSESRSSSLPRVKVQFASKIHGTENHVDTAFSEPKKAQSPIHGNEKMTLFYEAIFVCSVCFVVNI